MSLQDKEMEKKSTNELHIFQGYLYSCLGSIFHASWIYSGSFVGEHVGSTMG